MIQTATLFTLAASERPLMLIPTFVNGQGPYAFILDTGASHTVISTEVAQELGVVSGEQIEATATGGTIPVFKSCVASVAVGNAVQHDMQVRIADLTMLSQVMGSPIAGNLGYNFLTHFRVRIDYQSTLLYLDREDEAETLRGRWIRAPFRIADQQSPLLLLPTFVNGCGPYEFILDTGAALTVLAPSLVRELGLTQMEATTVVGANGATTAGVYILESFSVGNAKQRHTLVGIADIFDPLSQKVGARLDGVIGYNYLKAFQLILDYADETLLLQATPDSMRCRE